MFTALRNGNVQHEHIKSLTIYKQCFCSMQFGDLNYLNTGINLLAWVIRWMWSSSVSSVRDTQTSNHPRCNSRCRCCTDLYPDAKEIGRIRLLVRWPKAIILPSGCVGAQFVGWNTYPSCRNRWSTCSRLPKHFRQHYFHMKWAFK